jgi:Domain of unknown function (DUF4326)
MLMLRVINKHKASAEEKALAQSVMRDTVFGNPFIIGRDGDRAEVCQLYRQWIAQPEQAALRQRMRTELRGKNLLCCCAPLECHATTILHIANKLWEND